MSTPQKFREKQILDLFSKMASIFFELDGMWQYTPEGDKQSYEYIEEEDELQSNFERYAKEVYNIIAVYIEVENISNYLERFKADFDPIYASRQLLLDSSYNDESGEVYSTTLAKLWLFLKPFEFSHEGYEGMLIQQAGLKYLENILHATQSIVIKSKAEPRTEPQLYNIVKHVVNTVFPTSKDASSYFATIFRKYEPDILVPELKAAVEYKYARTEDDLKNQMGEIAEDTKVYTDDNNYEKFYAVFYVVEDFWGIKRFNTAWDEMKYPDNWKGIYVVGNEYKKEEIKSV